MRARVAPMHDAHTMHDVSRDHVGAPSMTSERAALLHPDLAGLGMSALSHHTPNGRVREAHGERREDRNASS